MIFRQFRTPQGDSFSYLFADPITRRAAIVDPTIESVTGYLDMLRAHDLSLRRILLTTPPPRLDDSAAWLRSQSGASVACLAGIAWAPADESIAVGDSLHLGEETVTAHWMPKRTTPCLLWRNRIFFEGGSHQAPNELHRLFTALIADPVLCPARPCGITDANSAAAAGRHQRSARRATEATGNGHA